MNILTAKAMISTGILLLTCLPLSGELGADVVLKRERLAALKQELSPKLKHWSFGTGDIGIWISSRSIQKVLDRLAAKPEENRTAYFQMTRCECPVLKGSDLGGWKVDVKRLNMSLVLGRPESTIQTDGWRLKLPFQLKGKMHLKAKTILGKPSVGVDFGTNSAPTAYLEPAEGDGDHFAFHVTTRGDQTIPVTASAGLGQLGQLTLDLPVTLPRGTYQKVHIPKVLHEQGRLAFKIGDANIEKKYTVQTRFDPVAFQPSGLLFTADVKVAWAD